MSRYHQHYCSCIFLSLVCLLIMSCIGEDHDEDKGISVGDFLPHFMVKAMICDNADWRFCEETVEITSDDFLGKMGVIVFFNTSCEDCQRELPSVQKWYDSIKGDEGYEVICISREEHEESIHDYWKKNDLTLPYSAQTDRTIYNLFAQTGIPRVYIINKEGVITDVKTTWPEMLGKDKEK